MESVVGEEDLMENNNSLSEESESKLVLESEEEVDSVVDKVSDEKQESHLDEASDEEAISSVASHRPKKKTLLLSDSEDENEVVERKEADTNFSPYEKAPDFISDSEGEERTSVPIPSLSPLKAPQLMQHDDESDDENDDDDISQRKESSCSRPKSDKDRSSDLFSIRSTSQRRLRESSIGLTAHVPKKLSLDEFLSRRQNAPETSIEDIYSTSDPPVDSVDSSSNNEDTEYEDLHPTPNVTDQKETSFPTPTKQQQRSRRARLLEKLGLKASLLESKPQIAPKSALIDLGPVPTPHKGLLDLQGRLAKQLTSSAPSSLKKDRVLSVTHKEVKDGEVSGVNKSLVTLPNEDDPEESSRLSFERVVKAKKSDVAGAQFRALRDTLKERMMENRKKDLLEKERLKKMEESEEGMEGEDDILDDAYDEDEDEMESEGTTESEPEEEPDIVEKPRLPKSNFVDEEAEDEDENSEEEGPLTLEEDSCNIHDSPPLQRQESKETNTPFSQIANGASIRWTPIEDRSEEEEEKDKPTSSLTQIQARKRLGFEELFDATDPSVDDMEDVVGLCSGQFIAARSLTTQDTLPKEDTQATLPFLGSSAALQQDDDEEDLLSSSGFKGRKSTQRIVMSDDSSDEEEEDKVESQSILPKEIVNDSEQEEEEEEGSVLVDEPQEVEDVAYDSEENEVPVKSLFDKRGLLREDFLEKEAELSGSDDGSEDEDDGEEGDELEMEEGDLDDLDQDQVREEVGKLHHAQLLNEDQREVRLFQEAFLEDGDLHSDKARGRSFRWLNNDDKTEELERRATDDEEEAEDEQAEKLRLERIERERWINKNSTSLLEASDDECENSENARKDDSQLMQLGNKALKRLQNTSKGAQGSKTETDSGRNLPLQPMMKNQSAKGSFLSRASSKLTKLAELSKNKGEGREGSGAKGNSRNFVFSALSPKKSEKKEGKKSKAKDDPISCPAKKKPKIERTLQDGNKSTIFGFL